MANAYLDRCFAKAVSVALLTTSSGRITPPNLVEGISNCYVLCARHDLVVREAFRMDQQCMSPLTMECEEGELCGLASFGTEPGSNASARRGVRACACI